MDGEREERDPVRLLLKVALVGATLLIFWLLFSGVYTLSADGRIRMNRLTGKSWKYGGGEWKEIREGQQKADPFEGLEPPKAK